MTDDDARPDAPLLCAACHTLYEDDDADRPVVCAACGAAICEGCEVQRCDEGLHACPLCGASMGECKSAEDDEEDEEVR